MKTEYITLKETAINNNCPECYSKENLILSFKQERKSSLFFSFISRDIIEDLDCKKCGSKIYPSQRTEDIDRVYEYHKKTIQPKSISFKLTTISYLILFLFVVMTILAILYFVFPEVLGQ